MTIKVRNLFSAAIIVASGLSGLPEAGSAADLANSGPTYAPVYRSMPLRHPYRAKPSFASGCPRQEPADYRPRLVGEPECQAARPFGLSPALYGPRLDVEWGAEY